MKRLLRGVQLLEGPGVPLQRTSALLEGQSLLAWGEAAEAGVDGSTQSSDAPPAALLAPVLVDPHSHLLDPFSGQAETLESLAAEAAAAGYGSVALLPQASEWRDRPEALQLRWPQPLQLLLWGAISSAGAGNHLAPLADLQQAGAVGFCDGESIPPLALLERVLLLGDADDLPLLVAPRDPSLAQSGLVREGVDTLRLGWPPEPLASELMPLQSLLALASRAPQLRLLNLSTAQAVEQLRQHPARPKASVCWWHLLQDHSTLDPLAPGWTITPVLGSSADRQALRAGLRDGVLQAVSVHHSPIDREEQMLPLDQRSPGVAGYQAVLPALWQALVVADGWQPSELWQALSWGPSAFLAQELEVLQPGTQRWLLFDPEQAHQPRSGSLAANAPLPAQGLKGQLLASGLLPAEQWSLDQG